MVDGQYTKDIAYSASAAIHPDQFEFERIRKSLDNLIDTPAKQFAILQLRTAAMWANTAMAEHGKAAFERERHQEHRVKLQQQAAEEENKRQEAMRTEALLLGRVMCAVRSEFDKRGIGTDVPTACEDPREAGPVELRHPSNELDSARKEPDDYK